MIFLILLVILMVIIGSVIWSNYQSKYTVKDEVSNVKFDSTDIADINGKIKSLSSPLDPLRNEPKNKLDVFMYTYQITPDTYTLSEEKRSLLFTLLETARIEFNANLHTSQQALSLSEYALAIAPVNPSETNGGDVVTIYAFPREYTKDRSDWFEGVLRDGYAFEHTVDGGGNSYFEAQVNVTTGTVIRFKTHAEALSPIKPTLRSFGNYTYIFMPKYFALAPEQLNAIFAILENTRSEFNKNIHSSRMAWPLADYVLVIVPVNPIIARTENVVVVFGIPRAKSETDPNWTDLVFLRDGYALGLGVRDGGPGYFTAEINLTTSTSSKFSTNGEA